MRLFRIPNLLVVALTQVLLYYGLIRKTYRLEGIVAAISDFEFSLLVITTVVITAAGYLINDLEDQAADQINNPIKAVVGVKIEAGLVQYFYFCLVLIGFLTSTLLAFSCQERSLLWIYPLAVVILASYSLYFKKRVLIGNILVASFCAGVSLIILLAERSSLKALHQQNPELANSLLTVIFLYAVFAFWATMFREIVKDIEDQEGDQAVHYKTLPIVWGQKVAKGFAFVSAAILLVCLLLTQFADLQVFSNLPMQFLLYGLMLVLILLMMILIKAKSTQNFHRLSQAIKWYMVAGILIILLF